MTRKRTLIETHPILRDPKRRAEMTLRHAIDSSKIEDITGEVEEVLLWEQKLRKLRQNLPHDQAKAPRV